MMHLLKLHTRNKLAINECNLFSNLKFTITCTNYSEQKGEFEAKFMVVVDETEFESANDPLTVETALKNSVALKRIGGYPVDPGSLVVGETSKIPAVIDEGF